MRSTHKPESTADHMAFRNDGSYFHCCPRWNSHWGQTGTGLTNGDTWNSSEWCFQWGQYLPGNTCRGQYSAVNELVRSEDKELVLQGGITHCDIVREAAGGGSLMVCIIWCIFDTHSCHSVSLNSCRITDHFAFPLTHFETSHWR